MDFRSLSAFGITVGISSLMYVQLAKLGASQLDPLGRPTEGGLELDSPGLHQ